MTADHHAHDKAEAQRAVSEGGGGESEGFELAEQELIDNASGAGGGTYAIIDDAAESEEAIAGHADGEADEERSSELR